MASNNTVDSSRRSTNTSIWEQEEGQKDKDRFNAKKLEGKIEKNTQDSIIENW